MVMLSRFMCQWFWITFLAFWGLAVTYSSAVNLFNVEHTRRRRSSNTFPNYYQQFIQSKDYYVELVLVFDQSMYKKYDQDLQLLQRRSTDIINKVNAMYNVLNIRIALVGIDVWKQNDHFNITDPADADDVLKNFQYYRQNRLNSQIPNDNAQLITAVGFTGGVVGKALKGTMCSSAASAGVNSDHSPDAGMVAVTVAHEIGHSFGMEHDTDACECPASSCIMSASTGYFKESAFFSICSLEYLQWGLRHSASYCLENIPTRFPLPTCGDSFVQAGEDCDCGLPEACRNPCCNAATCKFKPGAVCASGKCCDLNRCFPSPATTECRAAATECDLPEFCDGQVETCPSNVFKHDALECQSGKAYCFAGKCSTHDDQCRLIWGESGKSSPPACYDLNTRGQHYGNCGGSATTKTYVACAPDDVTCGRLQCSHQNERTDFGDRSVVLTGQVSVSDPDNRPQQIVCREAMIDLGAQMPDPGLVPDGARCSKDKICVNQTCTSASALLSISPCPNGCSGRGICNSKSHCHCDVGYGGTDCSGSGPGGSIDSGPLSYGGNFNVGLAVLIFLVVVVPLLTCVITVVHRYRFLVGTKLANLLNATRQQRSQRRAGGSDSSGPSHPKTITVTALPSALHFGSSSIVSTTSVSRPGPVAKADLKGGRNANAAALPQWPSPPSIPKSLSQIKSETLVVRSAPPPPTVPTLLRVTTDRNLSLASDVFLTAGVELPGNAVMNTANPTLKRNQSGRRSLNRPKERPPGRPKRPSDGALEEAYVSIADVDNVSGKPVIIGASLSSMPTKQATIVASSRKDASDGSSTIQADSLNKVQRSISSGSSGSSGKRPKVAPPPLPVKPKLLANGTGSKSTTKVNKLRPSEAASLEAKMPTPPLGFGAKSNRCTDNAMKSNKVAQSNAPTSKGTMSLDADDYEDDGLFDEEES